MANQMNIDVEWFEELLDMYQTDPDACNSWQQQFMDDFSDKVERYGERTLVSDGQLTQLNRIARIYGAEEMESD